MARKKIGKRGSAIIVLMVVAAIAGSPSTAAAATPGPTASLSAPAPAPAVVTSPCWPAGRVRQLGRSQLGRKVVFRAPGAHAPGALLKRSPVPPDNPGYESCIRSRCGNLLSGGRRRPDGVEHEPERPTSHTAKRAEAQATAAVGSLNFTGAATELEAYKAEHATYAGAALAPAFGVTVMRADATSYCLQAGVGGTVQHFIGPGGTPATGSFYVTLPGVTMRARRGV